MTDERRNPFAVKRYRLGLFGMVEHPDGEWIKVSDVEQVSRKIRRVREWMQGEDDGTSGTAVADEQGTGDPRDRR